MGIKGGKFMNLKKINETIFREYDVRGIYGEDLDIDVAYTFGRSFASYIQGMGNDTVIVGHDNIESSPVLSEVLIKGFIPLKYILNVKSPEILP